MTLRELSFTTWLCYLANAGIAVTSVITFRRLVYPSTQYNVVIVGRCGGGSLTVFAWHRKFLDLQPTTRGSGAAWIRPFSCFDAGMHWLVLLWHWDGEKTVEGGYCHVY